MAHFWSEARALWRSAGDRREEARAFYAEAVLRRLTGAARVALALGLEALPRWRQLGDRLGEGATWNEVGLDHWLLGETAEARAAFERAAEIHAQAGDRYGEAASRSNLCLMDLARGAVREGVACYERAIPRLREAGAPALEGAALTSAGRAWDVLGEPERALASYRQALERLRAVGDRAGEARVQNNLGVLSEESGEAGQALAFLGQALETFEALGDRRWQARVLGNLGRVYHRLGDPGRAVPPYEEALALRREVGDRAGEAVTRINLGLAHLHLGDPGKARDLHRQALGLYRAAGDRRGEGLALLHLGRDDLESGTAAEALASLGEAVEILRSVEDLSGEAEALRLEARARIALGAPEQALPGLERALTIARAARLPFGEAEALYQTARAERALGRAAAAREHAAAALDSIERVRAGIGSPDLRASYSAVKDEAYQLHRDLLMEAHRAAPGEGHERAALATVERARARTLLELLQEAGVEAREEADPALLDRQASLERRLSAKGERALRERDAAARASLEEEQDALLRELDLVEAEVRAGRPGYAALTRPRPLAATEVQALLDPETVLLSYSLGRERSYLWIVTRESFESAELPGSAALEALARRLHQGWSAFDPAGRPAEEEAAAELGRLLLGPAAHRLGARRLAVIPDGALCYVPFGALPHPANGLPLLARQEVVHLPSASALAVQRQRLAARPPAPRPIAVLADPLFARASEWESPAFEPLPASREEAEAIAALLPPGQALVALGAEAERSRVLGDRLSEFRVVHFATHGVLDTERPALSGLILSTVDERGAPREGLLHLRDVYGLHLGADLVVLSGCRTALGREIRGEGLLGLARGFQYAGARRVLASLWRVEDRATAVLMAAFYRALWEDGLPAAAALREAQLHVRRQRRWRDPYFWAGFVLEGDWR